MSFVVLNISIESVLDVSEKRKRASRQDLASLLQLLASPRDLLHRVRLQEMASARLRQSPVESRVAATRVLDAASEQRRRSHRPHRCATNPLIHTDYSVDKSAMK